MYDLAMPAHSPGQCPKCHGSGEYHWGATINGNPAKSGSCHSCQGTGQQSRSDIARNRAYNRHKLANMEG